MRFVIFNQKGGVGKSTLTCNLAAQAAAKGHRTLVVDLDAQANSTQYLLGEQFKASSPTLADYFESCLNLSATQEAMDSYCLETPFENLHLLAANPAMEVLQAPLLQRQKLYKLRRLLDALKDFDFVFMDTPPAFNFYSQSALIAGDQCLIPFDCDLFSSHGIEQMLIAIEDIHTSFNAQLTLGGIIVNQYNPQAGVHNQWIEALTEKGLPLLKPFITSSVKLRESHNAYQPMATFAPSHKLTQEYAELFEAIKHNAASQQSLIESLSRVMEGQKLSGASQNGAVGDSKAGRVFQPIFDE